MRAQPLSQPSGNETTLIFIHIPKAAGTTLRSIIERQFPRDAIWSLYPPRYDDLPKCIEEFQALPLARRAQIRYVQGHIQFGIHEALPGPCTYFTMLRKPADWLISDYYYVLRHPEHWRYSTVQGMSLDDYARWLADDHETNWQTRCISGDIGPTSPSSPLPADALDRATQNLTRHFVGFGVVERFDETLLLLRRRFAWKNVLYVKQNVAPNRISTDDLPRRTLALIEQCFDADWALYTFAAQTLDERIRAEGDSFRRELRRFQAVNAAYSALWTTYQGARRRVARALRRS